VFLLAHAQFFHWVPILVQMYPSSWWERRTSIIDIIPHLYLKVLKARHCLQ
jgi:hypothetical protein